jgi:hypothetical protein
MRPNNFKEKVEKVFKYNDVFDEDKEQKPVWKSLSEKRGAIYLDIETLIKYVTKKDELKDLQVQEFWWEDLTKKCIDSFKNTDWNEIEFSIISFKKDRNNQISKIFSPDLKFFEASEVSNNGLVFLQVENKESQDFIFEFNQSRYIFIFIKIKQLEHLMDYSMRPMFAISFSP